MEKKKQNHMMTYEIYVESHGKIRKFVLQNRTLKDALHNLLNQCIEEDDTGIFFELENANIEILKKNPKFRVISNQKYGSFGIVLHDVKCIKEGRDAIILDMRAKRELYGYSLESLAKEIGCSATSLRQREEGVRGLKVQDYMTIMKVFESKEMVN